MQAFGGFHLGPLHLVLPMAALREVLPCGTLLPLPCPAASVVGGIVLRGVTVPVVDLRLALGQPATPPGTQSCVVVMVEAGCILGLLADGVTGVFHVAATAIHRMQPAAAAGPALAADGQADASAAVLAGSVQVAGSEAPLLLLSPTALARLPQVPLVVDPEPGRQHLALRDNPAAARAAPAAARPLLLMRSGGKPLAVDAMGVHATLAHPQVLPSPLAMGHCRGVIPHDGLQVPLLDLLAVAGLGRSDLSGSFQAFLLRLPAGLVAFAVDAVVDVVRVADAAVLAVPALALPEPALCAGAVPMTALPAEVVARVATPAQQFLLLDVQALKAHADVAGLAATNTPLAGGALAAAGGPRLPRHRAAAPARRPMITYALAGETATPIEQVSEILPYAPEAAVFAGPGALLGMVVNRGRSIPLLCLSRLNGLPSPAVSPAVSVLVVECDGVPVGFAVPQLRSIELADWPLAAGDTTAASSGGGGPLQTAGLARVGSDAQQRLLQVLDLAALARSLQSPGLARAA